MKKSILVGIGIYIFGYITIFLCIAIFLREVEAEFSYYYGIIFAILYLSAVVGISASLILKELKNSHKN